VLGFDPVSRSWITEASAGSVVGIPPLDGMLLTDDATLSAFTDDLGHIIHRRPFAVLEPVSVDDIIRMVRFAREQGIKIGARGQGHTMFGQSLVEAGIVIDMEALDTDPVVAADRVHVRAGVKWRTVLETTLAAGPTVPVITGYLGLSVGGTLSVGGIGGTSYRFGAQVDNVLELQVVTGAGQLQTCSPGNRPDLFRSVLAGLGQCAIIVQATLRLVPAKSNARVFMLFYPDLFTMLGDERVLIADGRFDHVLGYVVPSPGGGWLQFIEAAVYFSPPATPDNSALLAGLNFVPSPPPGDVPYFAFADRVAPLIDALKANGRINLPHPWFDVFVPDSVLYQYAGGIFANLTPADLGPDFPILFFAMKSAAFHQPLLRIPHEEVFWLFDILSTAPSSAVAAQMVARNRRFFELARDLGSKRYVISAIPFSQHDWQQHFQPVWGQLVSAKRHFDPDNVLTPGPGIFPS
jgi:FAD/FMN-containing dehydrogenase